LYCYKTRFDTTTAINHKSATSNIKTPDMSVIPETVNTNVRFVEHDTGSLQFSAFHYHHNREPYYVLFIKVPDCDGSGDKLYIEKIDTHSHNNKYVYDVVMPFEVMESNECLKKYYDMSVMLVNTGNSVYYDNLGMYSKNLIQTYDTDSDSDAEESDNEEDDICDDSGEKRVKKEKGENGSRQKIKRSIRRWCINCDTIWKNLRVYKQSALNCYYNIDPFTYEYKMATEKQIDSFITHFNNFTKYTGVSRAIKEEITANYNNSMRLIRE
jgi:hypothetical protein